MMFFRIIFYSVFLISLACCNQVDKQQKEEFVYIRTISSASRDTIRLGDSYRSKIYLDTTMLYDIAKSRGIKEYVSMQIWDGDSLNLIGKTVPVYSDTGYVEFNPILRWESSQKVVPYFWRYIINIDFDPNKKGIDTTFSADDVFYIKREGLLSR